MTEFYKWAADNLIAFVVITAVLVFAVGFLLESLIETWRKK